MKKSNQFEYLLMVMSLVMAITTIVGGKPIDYETRSTVTSPSTAWNTSYKIFGETYHFDRNQLTPVLENLRYTVRAANGQIHVVDVITDQSGTSTKAHQIENGNEFRQTQKNPTDVPVVVQQNFALPPIDSRMDAAASKLINHHQFDISWLSHGFTSVLPAQTQFQHIFMPSPIPLTSIVVPFAVVFNPYASTSTSPSLIHNSDKPIDPQLINSIFQVPQNEHKYNNSNYQYAGSIPTSLQPPYYSSTPPPRPPLQTSSSTLKPPASSTPYYNYFGTSSAPTRPSYLPPTDNAVNDFDIRHLKDPSTEQPTIINNNRFLIGNDDVPSDINLSVSKPSIELLPPLED